MSGGRIQIDVASLSEGELRELVVRLLHQVADLERQLYGRRSEKARYLELDPRGLLPFPEFAQLLTEAPAAQEKAATITVPAQAVANRYSGASFRIICRGDASSAR